MFATRDWIAVGGLLLAAAGFARLGQWQLDRAEVNRSIEKQFAAAATLPIVAAPVSADDRESLRFRRVSLAGEYEPDMQILLDNMTHAGQAGYQVLTPFRFGPDRLVLVNRGWIAGSPDRSVLPDVALRSTVTAVTGRIDHLPRAALQLDAPPPARKSQVYVLSFPDFAAIEAVLGEPLAPFQLLLDADAPDGFVREWTPHSDLADRNIAYAVQWFGLAALAVGGVIIIVVRGNRQAPEAGP